MATPIAAGMIFQTLYFLVDLYFVGRLGGAAIAGVGSAGNLAFLVMAMTQVLGVGTVSLIAQAVGRKDQPQANLVFNQSSVLAVACLAGLPGAGLPVRGALCRRPGIGSRDAHCRRDLPALVPAGTGPAVRAGRDGLGAARHWHRQAGHDRPDAHRGDQRHSRAGADRRLGHRASTGRGRRRSGQLDRDRCRRSADVGVFPASRALRRFRPTRLAAARGRLAADPRHRYYLPAASS